MKNRIKVFLATLAMILTFAMSYACTAYAGPALGFDTQTVVIETVETEKLAPQKSPAPVEEILINDHEETLTPEPMSEEDSISMVTLTEEKKVESQSQTKNLPSTKQSGNIIEDLPFIVDGKISKKLLQQQVEAWNLIPESLRNTFEEDGWSFIITDGDLAKKYSHLGYNEIAGITDHGEHTIYVEDRGKILESTTIHEFGHYLNSVSGNPVYSEEWEKIYENEKQWIKNTKGINQEHAVSSESEYFAAVFAQAILYPEKTKEMAPESYEFIMNCLNKIENVNTQTPQPETNTTQETKKDPQNADNTPTPTSVITPEPTPVITPEPTPAIMPTPIPVDVPTPNPVITPTPAQTSTPEPTAVVPPSIEPLVTPVPIDVNDIVIVPIPSPETTREKNAEQEP